MEEIKNLYEKHFNYLLKVGVTQEYHEKWMKKHPTDYDLSELAHKVQDEQIAGGDDWIERVFPALDDFDIFRVESLTEEEKQPPEFIVEGMIPVGMTFLSGAPKIRKSFLALQLAIAVAKGQNFLGMPTKKSAVLYFDLEGSKSRISSRANQMNVTVPDDVLITNKTDFKIADELPKKIKLIHRQNPQIRLYIIDTYSRARGNVKANGANAYDLDVQLLESMQRMALEEKIAVFFVHHDKKGASHVADSFERLSGTMGISGSADSVLNLVATGKRFDGKATLEYNPRDAKGGEINLYFDEMFCEWQITEPKKTSMEKDPAVRWFIENAPNCKQAGQFFSYEDAYRNIYKGGYTDKAATIIKEDSIRYREELFVEKGIAIQTGVKCSDKRGIRIFRVF